MRPLLALLAIALVSVCICACGSTNSNTSSSSSAASNSLTMGRSNSPSTPKTATVSAAPENVPAPVKTKTTADKGNDLHAPEDHAEGIAGVLNFGYAASPADERAIASLVKRYYMVALAEDGAKACSSLLDSSVAQDVPKDYGTSPAAPHYMRGKTCPEVMVNLFKHQHRELAAEVPKFHVLTVRLIEHHGFAVLAFGRLPGRRISVMREGHLWKIETLMGIELP